MSEIRDDVAETLPVGFTNGVPSGTATVTVVVGVGRDVRPIVVWAGDRTRLEDRLVAAFERFERRPHFLDEARTRWCAEIDVPVGRVVTTARGQWPSASEVFLVTEAGLEPLGYDAAWDLLDPAGAADRAAQREHDARADAEALHRELTRFVGSHGLRDGIHAIGNSFVFAERCTPKQVYWRRATRAEVKALED